MLLINQEKMLHLHNVSLAHIWIKVCGFTTPATKPHSHTATLATTGRLDLAWLVNQGLLTFANLSIPT